MTDANITGGKRGYRLADHPWVALPIFMVVTVVLLGLVGALFTVAGLSPSGPLQQTLFHVLLLFVVTPFVLGLPKGRKGLVAYLDDIRLSRISPVLPLVLLGLSCWVILALCQGLGTVVYRLTEGEEISLAFLLSVWDLRGSLPPRSAELLVSLPSALEEVAFRGVVITLFMSRYSRNKSIVISAVAFGAMHLLNLTGGQDPVWVLGQVTWAFLLGLMYGYLFIKSDSLLPGMILHYLGNAFVASIMAYLNANATMEDQALYGVVFTFGLVPVAMTIAWVRYFSRRWLPRLR